MRKKMNFYPAFILLTAFIVLSAFSACQKDILHANDHLDAEQLVAGRLDGTWASPRDIVTPAKVPAEVFGAMRLVFTTDENGYPSKFIAKDCPIVFTGETGGWHVSGTQDSARVELTGVTPVDDFAVRVSSSSMTLSFHMGWENTDTGETGEGDFRVTLSRQ